MSKYGYPGNFTTIIKNEKRFCAENFFNKRKHRQIVLWFSCNYYILCVDYLVAVKIYNTYFGILVLCKCSEFINIYYCAMQHELPQLLNVSTFFLLFTNSNSPLKGKRDVII